MDMLSKRILSALCLTCFLFCACSTLNRDLKLERDLENAENLLEQREQEKQNIETQYKNIRLGYANLEQKLQDQESMNLSLSNKVNKLEFDLKKRNAVVQLQENVIQLLDDPNKTIETSLKDQIEAKLLEIEKAEGKTKLVFLNEDIFLRSSINLSKKGKNLLVELANSIKKNKLQSIVVEGHTDNIPVSGSSKHKFPTNWEISTARAVAVVRFLQEKGGIEPERLSAVGYSYYRPAAPNDTKEGRRQNRRVEIILGPPM